MADEELDLEQLYEMSDSSEYVEEPDADLRATLLRAAKAWDDVATVTRYFVTVEYVDRDGHMGLMNITPQDVPTWQLTAIHDHGGELWERFAEAVQFSSEPVPPDEGDEE